MAVRSSMVDLIKRVQRLIGDPIGDTQTWDEDLLQEALDRYQTRINYGCIAASLTYAPGGTIVYKRYESIYQNWEAGVELVDQTYTPMTPDTSDLLAGRWLFTANTGQIYLYVSGCYYDVYGAAADILENWAAKLKKKFDFSDGQQSMKRSQMAAACLDLANQYRMQQSAVSVSQVRTDVGDGGSAMPLPPGFNPFIRGDR